MHLNNSIMDWAKSIYFCSGSSAPICRKTSERSLTKRGVLWLGQTCNLRCFFCYFINKIKDKEHPEHKFMSLEKAKEICRKLREVYGNTSIDIQGGEPTIYPDIIDLVKYCSSIGLKPTLITNAIVLSKEEVCKAYKEAGINDFLISTHGLGETFDKIVGLKGGSELQLKGIYNLQKTGVPFRFNCTLTKQALSQLKYIATMAVETNAKAINFITFNPFADQQGVERSVENVPKYSEIKAHLEPVLDMLEKAGIEANVRYLPLCMLSDKYRKNIYNFQQLPYDHHEWDYNSWTWTTRFNQRSSVDEIDETIPILLYGVESYGNVDFGNASMHGTREHYMRDIDIKEHMIKLFSSGLPKETIYRQNAKLRAEKHCGYSYSSACEKCSVKAICDGFHSDYAAILGSSEAVPVRLGKNIDDPKYYISKQFKVIDA